MSIYMTVACIIFASFAFACACILHVFWYIAPRLLMESFFFQFKYPKFSSITHMNPDPKDMNITFLWKPVKRMTENITVRFYATLIKKYDTFWLKASSNEIHVLVSA